MAPSPTHVSDAVQSSHRLTSRDPRRATPDRAPSADMAGTPAARPPFPLASVHTPPTPAGNALRAPDAWDRRRRRWKGRPSEDHRTSGRQQQPVGPPPDWATTPQTPLGRRTRPHQQQTWRARPCCAHTSAPGPCAVLPARPWPRAGDPGGDRTARTCTGVSACAGPAHPTPASHATALGGHTRRRTHHGHGGLRPGHRREREPGAPNARRPPHARHAAPNASAHLLPEAGAERTLEAVRCSAWFGAVLDFPSTDSIRMP